MHIWLPTIKAGSGSDVFAERLASGLNSAGHEATITWLPHLCEIMPEILLKVAAPEGTDIIHTNTSYAFAFERTGLPLVATELHYLLDPAFRPYKSLAQHLYHRFVVSRSLRKTYACANAITAISEFTAQVLEKEAGLEKVAAIPLWVDTRVFKPGVVFEQKRNDIFKLLFIGNSSRRKGADVIAKLAPMLGMKFEIRCTAGLRQQFTAERLGNVKILGRLSEEELVREYQEADAVLVPSRYEGFGYAALEGMACAKPIVGFRSGAVAEVVGAAGNEMLVEIDDLAGLAEMCRTLATDPELSEMAGRQGLERCAALYSERSAIGSYIDLYTELIAVGDRRQASEVFNPFKRKRAS